MVHKSRDVKSLGGSMTCPVVMVIHHGGVMGVLCLGVVRTAVGDG